MSNQGPTGAWNTYPASAAQLAWTDSTGSQNVFTFDCVISERWTEPAEVSDHPVEVGADVSDHVRVGLREVELHVWATNEPIDANNWDEATLATTTLTFDGSPWVPGPNAITIPSWDNPITLRSLGGSLVGIAGGLIGGALGGAHTGMVAADIAALVGLEAAFLALPASASPDVVQTTAGLAPTPASSVQVQTQQWPGGSDGVDYVAKTIQQLKLLKNTAQQIDVIGSKDFCSPMVITSIVDVRDKDTGSGCDITLTLREVRLVSTKVVAAPIPNLSSRGANMPQNKGKKEPSDASPQTQVSVAKQIMNAVSAMPPGSISQLLGSFLGL